MNNAQQQSTGPAGQRRAPSSEQTDRIGRVVATWVAEYRRQHRKRHGRPGPTWRETGAQFGITTQPDWDRMIRALAAAGWLTFKEDKRGSLKPGPKYLETLPSPGVASTTDKRTGGPGDASTSRGLAHREGTSMDARNRTHATRQVASR